MSDRTYLYIILFLLQQSVFALEKDIRFRRIEAETGFPSKNIESILQDNSGFLWFGTFDGLIRYDGTKYSVYKNDKADSTSLGSRGVYSLKLDSQGRMWAGGYSGLSMYNPDCDCFSVFRHDSIDDFPIRAIAFDEKDNLWVGTEIGLYLFIQETKSYTKILADSVVYAMKAHEKILYISTVKKGLTLLDVETRKIIKRIDHSLYPNFKSENSTVLDIDVDKDGIIWFVTGKGGMYEYNPSNDSLIRHKIELKEKGSIPTFYSIYHFSERNILIGTQNFGFLVYDPETGEHVKYSPEDKTDFSISSKTVRSIVKTDDNTVWFGTHLGTVSYFHVSDLDVRYYFVDKKNENGLGYDVISGFAEDDKGRIWLTTDGGGINIFNKQTGHFSKINSDQGLLTNSVTDIAFDGDKHMWVALWLGGVMRINTETLCAEVVYYDSISLSKHRSPNCIKGLFLDSKKRLFVFPLFTSVMIFENEGKQIYTKENPGNYPDEIFEMQILIDAAEDTSGNIWLYGFDEFGLLTKNNKFRKFSHNPHRENSPSANDLLNIFVDSKNNAWISTFDGFDKYNQTTDKYDRVSDIYNFPRTVFSVLEDDDGYMWISSSEGFGKFHPDTMQIIFFEKNIGLVGDDYINRSCFKDNDGEMYFGSTNGFIRFHPEKVKVNQTPPNVIFSDFYLFNDRIGISDTLGLLQKPMSETDTIVLKYYQNIIGFKFAATNYVAPSKNQYAYRMVGFNSKWNYVGHKNEATYTNLNPGQYTLEVKAANNEGVWSVNAKKLTIIVQPPWWQTWWFKVLFVVAVIGLVVLVIYLRTKQITLQNKVLEQKVNYRTNQLKNANEELLWANKNLLEQKKEIEAQRNEIFNKNAHLIESNEEIEAQKDELEKKNQELEELNDTKNKFFSIIAHDLKNPLGAMLGFADLLNSSFDKFSDEKKKKFINVIAGSSRNLLDLLENLLQWARSQSGAMPFTPKIISVNGLINENIIMLKHHANKKNINLLFETKELFELTADENMLSTAIRNITSNAIKFTPRDGTITFAVAKKNQQIEITIADTGVGMKPEQIENLFKVAKNKSTKGTDSETGTGLGMILCKEFIEMHNGKIEVKSEKDKGSVFVVKLPVS